MLKLIIPCSKKLLKYMRNKLYLTLVCFSMLFWTTSCRYFSLKRSDKQNAIARVYDSYLYKKDIKNLVPKNIDKKDSIIFVNNIINTWAKQQLLLRKAQINMNEDSLNLNKLVQQYKEDLFINKYKEAVVDQYLDTVVSNEDINKYYKENSNNFKLNENLIKLKYIHLGNDILNKKYFVKLFKSNKQKDIDSLENKKLQLKEFQLNDSIWVSYSDVKSKIPILKSFKDRDLLKKSKFIQKKDSLGLYLVAIKDVRLRNKIAPKSYIKPIIRQMILHQRKLDLIKKIEGTLVVDALNKNHFETY